MKYVMLEPAEVNSAAFEDFCEHLGMDGTETDRIQALGLLAVWRSKWGGDPKLETGLFFDISLRRLGVWAKSPSPEKFGNALLKAGFVCKVEDAFPPELLAGRTGYYVPDHIRRAWGYLKSRANARELILFIDDPERRTELAAQKGLSLEGVPDGWILGRSPANSETIPRQLGDVSEMEPENEGDNSEMEPEKAVTPSETPFTTIERKNVKEGIKKENITQRRKEARKPPKKDDPRLPRVDGKTGREPTTFLRTIIREFMYEQPMDALMFIDDGENARRLWGQVLDENEGYVKGKLAELTENWSAWMKLDNPAAVLTHDFTTYLKDVRKRRGKRGRGERVKGVSEGVNHAEGDGDAKATG